MSIISGTHTMNVRRDGAVKQGRNTASRSASVHGTVTPGSIDGSLSPEWYRHRRCFPLHPPRSVTDLAITGASRRPTDRAAPANCETRAGLVGARNSCTLRDVLILVDQSAESVVSSDVVDHGWGAAGEGS